MRLFLFGKNSKTTTFIALLLSTNINYQSNLLAAAWLPHSTVSPLSIRKNYFATTSTVLSAFLGNSNNNNNKSNQRRSLAISSTSIPANFVDSHTDTTNNNHNNHNNNNNNNNYGQMAVTPFVRPERVVLENALPELFVYDHCPFCVRVRFALGVKNVKHRLHFLANDDVETPTRLIGKKLAPIFKWEYHRQSSSNNNDNNNNDEVSVEQKGDKDNITSEDSNQGDTMINDNVNGSNDIDSNISNKDSIDNIENNNDDSNSLQVVVMPESMDIIQYVDSNESFGPTFVIAPATGRTDLADWQKSVRDLLRTLQRPRYVATGLLPEFQQLDGRHAFIRNHQMPPYSIDEWKNKMDMSAKLNIYAEYMAKDPAADVEELNRKLVELDDIVYSEHYCSQGGLSYDDVDLFSRLRSVTIIRDVKWPQKLRKYMDNMAELSDIPLYDEMAL